MAGHSPKFMRTGLPGSLLLLAAVLPAQQPLDGTKPLDRTGDLAMEMIAGIDRYLDETYVAERPAPYRSRQRPSRPAVRR